MVIEGKNGKDAYSSLSIGNPSQSYGGAYNAYSSAELRL